MTRILADSTCDLSAELLQKYDITMVPLHIVLGDKEYRDIVEISPDEIYAWSDENKTTPKTSAASYDDAQEALNAVTAALSSMPRNCDRFSNANEALEAFENEKRETIIEFIRWLFADFAEAKEGAK